MAASTPRRSGPSRLSTRPTPSPVALPPVPSHRVSLHPLPEPYRRPAPTLRLERRDRRWGTVGGVLSDGRGYVFMGDVLAIFELPDAGG